MFDLYIQNEYWFAAGQLFLAMLGMGATMTVRDFQDVVREPKSFGIGAAMQVVLVPVLAWLFIQVFGISGALVVGLAICAAIPGGTVSNIFTLLARGNVALSISITAVTTVACLVTTPIVLDWLIGDDMPENFTMPVGRIAFEIGVCLLLPLVAGMLVFRYGRSWADAFSTWCIRGSLFIILLIVIGSLGSGRLNLQAFGVTNILLMVAFIALLCSVGWLLPRVLGLSRGDTSAIGMEITVRSTNLGLLIKAVLFPAVAGQPDPWGDTVLFAVLLYGGLMLIVSAVLIVWRRRQSAD